MAGLKIEGPLYYQAADTASQETSMHTIRALS